ncbi:hypothetical protein [Streptosporangium roseum]|uniref:hypothetical protein n=1 Tax=Streptosporangium roseum TaxID=2001 RepID=UPI0004CDA072|nr:hypothetical protein [Streptosporangium roseum]
MTDAGYVLQGFPEAVRRLMGWGDRMTAGDGFAYDGSAFGEVAASLEGMAERLGSLRYAGDRVALPTWALGGAGEWPARHEYGKTWGELEQEFQYGESEGMSLADMMRRTRKGYAGAESASIRRVLDAVTEARNADPGELSFSSGFSGGYSDYEMESFGEYLMDSTALSYGAGVAAMGAGAGNHLISRWEKEGKDLDLAGRRRDIKDASERRIRRVGDSIVRHMEDTNWTNNLSERDKAYRNSLYTQVDELHAERERRLSELAKCSKGTQANLVRAKAFSWAVMAGGLAWTVMIVPSDEDLDRAVAGWGELAYYCGEVVGHDTGLVREAIAAAWAGPAMDAADARLVEFVAAGVHLAERVRRLSDALSDTVEDLDRIHKAALVFSIASLGAIMGAGIAARFNPALRPVVELLGARLSAVTIVCANLAPAAAAGAIAWYRAYDASRATKIGDREITGFRRP